MKEKLEKLYKELGDLRKESDEIFLKIKHVRDQITRVEEAESCKNLEDFTRFFENSGGKIVKVHRHTIYAAGGEYNTYYIGTVLSEEEMEELKKGLEGFGELVKLLPTKIPIKNTICVQEDSVMAIGDWEINYNMLYDNNSQHETYQVEFITKEEADELIASHTPKL